MKKTFTFKSFINAFVLLCISTVSYAQQQANDSTLVKKYPDVYGFRIGIDALSATRNVWDKDFKGIDIITDFRINKDWYAAIEGGFVDKYKDEDRMDFSTKGAYVRVGVDRNLHKNWLDMNNMIYFGGRYGFSLFQQELHSYDIIIPGDYLEELNIKTNQTSTGLHAHWLELVAGMKAEISPNLFLGMAFRIHGLVYQKQPEAFENLYIPGFGKKYSGAIGASFNYSVSYLFPLKKKYEKIEF